MECTKAGLRGFVGLFREKALQVGGGTAHYFSTIKTFLRPAAVSIPSIGVSIA